MPWIRRDRAQLGVASITIPNDHRARAVDADELLGIEPGAPVEFDLDALRPKTRGECVAGIRPCPFVGCAHHLYLDVDPDTGSLKINHPGSDLHDLAETCALDVAARGGGVTLDEIGGLLNVTRERARQVEVKALHLARAKALDEGVTSDDATGFAHAAAAEGEAA